MAITKFNEAIEFDYRRQSEWAPVMWHFWVMLGVASVIFAIQLLRDIIEEAYHLFTGLPLIEKESKDEY